MVFRVKILTGFRSIVVFKILVFTSTKYLLVLRVLARLALNGIAAKLGFGTGTRIVMARTSWHGCNGFMIYIIKLIIVVINCNL